MGPAGYLTLFRFRGVPVRIHWTTPLCALLAGRFEFVPGVWLGFVLLVLIHEAGHALVVRATGNRALSIEVHGLGGLCRWMGEPTPIQRAMIAWGGVWAQMALWVVTQAALIIEGPPTSAFWAQMATAFTSVNVWIMMVNLLPVPPLDGAEAWPLFGLLRAKWRRGRALAKKAELLKARTGAVIRLEVAQAERKASRAIAAMDEVDDLKHGVTPEVKAVLDRARAIAEEEGPREVAQRSSAAKQGRDR